MPVRCLPSNTQTGVSSNQAKTTDDNKGQDESKSAKNKGVTSSKVEGKSTPNKPAKVPTDDKGRTANVTNSNKPDNKLSNKPTKTDSELAEIIKAWPDLSPDTRTAITAIVRASINKQE